MFTGTVLSRKRERQMCVLLWTQTQHGCHVIHWKWHSQTNRKSNKKCYEQVFSSSGLL